MCEKQAPSNAGGGELGGRHHAAPDPRPLAALLAVDVSAFAPGRHVAMARVVHCVTLRQLAVATLPFVVLPGKGREKSERGGTS